MSSYSATLLPAGFHPVLSVQLHSNSNDDASSSTDACPIYLHLSLPPSFIADRFQLAQLHSEGRLGAPSLDNVSHSFSATGERNLEWPVALANRSEVVIRLREGNGKGKGKEEQWDIPLHLRYQVPILERWSRGARRDKVEVDLEWPTLYSVCEPGQTPPPGLTACAVASQPPSHLHPSSSTVYYFPPHGTLSNAACPPSPLPTLVLTVPTGVVADLPIVETVNFVAVWLGMLWVGWSAFKVRRRWGLQRRGAVTKKSE